MRSTVNQTLVLELIAQKYKDGMLPVDIVGQSVVSDGVNLPYFEEALKANKLGVVLDVGKALAGVGVNVSMLTGGGPGL